MREFWPEDTPTCKYRTSLNAQELMDLIQENWPGVDLNEISIETEYIHTDCLGYDLYDSGDYTKFIVITCGGSGETSSS